jgi:hypothetical protein
LFPAVYFCNICAGLSFSISSEGLGKAQSDSLHIAHHASHVTRHTHHTADQDVSPQTPHIIRHLLLVTHPFQPYPIQSPCACHVNGRYHSNLKCACICLIACGYAYLAVCFCAFFIQIQFLITIYAHFTV